MNHSLSYDIEQLWIEGRNPLEIAGKLDCHVELVNDWIKSNGLNNQGNLNNWDHYSDLPSPAHYDESWLPGRLGTRG